MLRDSDAVRRVRVRVLGLGFRLRLGLGLGDCRVAHEEPEGCVHGACQVWCSSRPCKPFEAPAAAINTLEQAKKSTGYLLPRRLSRTYYSLRTSRPSFWLNLSSGRKLEVGVVGHLCPMAPLRAISIVCRRAQAQGGPTCGESRLKSGAAVSALVQLACRGRRTPIKSRRRRAAHSVCERAVCDRHPAHGS